MRRYRDTSPIGGDGRHGREWSARPNAHLTYGTYALPPLAYGGIAGKTPTYSHLPLGMSSTCRYPHSITDTTPTMSEKFAQTITSPIKVTEPVVFNAGFTFRINETKPKVFDHVRVDPASSVPHTESSSLTKKIDRFLRKSDHSLDRFDKILKGKKPRLYLSGRASPSLGRASAEPSCLRRTSADPYSQGRVSADFPSRRRASVEPPSFRRTSVEPPGSGRLSADPYSISNGRISNSSKDSLHRIEAAVSPCQNGISTSSPSSCPPSTADIASQAERHRQILARVMARGRLNKKNAPVEKSVSSSSSSSSDEEDNSESEAHWTFSRSHDHSNDTSAEISKLDDLSSGSEDEYFDVHPLPGFFCIPAHPQLVANDNQRKGSQTQKANQGLKRLFPFFKPSTVGSSVTRVPLHSQSLPAVNKILHPPKMGNTQQPQVSRPATPLELQPVRSHKKYPAPPPPLSREQSIVSSASQSPRSSVDLGGSQQIKTESLIGGLDDSSYHLKRARRSPSLKKYPAPQPPVIPQGESITFKTSSLPRGSSSRNINNELIDKSSKTSSRVSSEQPFSLTESTTETDPIKRHGSPSLFSHTSVPVRIKSDYESYSNNRSSLDSQLSSKLKAAYDAIGQNSFPNYSSSLPKDSSAGKLDEIIVVTNGEPFDAKENNKTLMKDLASDTHFGRSESINVPFDCSIKVSTNDRENIKNNISDVSRDSPMGQFISVNIFNSGNANDTCKSNIQNVLGSDSIPAVGGCSDSVKETCSSVDKQPVKLDSSTKENDTLCDTKSDEDATEEMKPKESHKDSFGIEKNEPVTNSVKSHSESVRLNKVEDTNKDEKIENVMEKSKIKEEIAGTPTDDIPADSRQLAATDENVINKSVSQSAIGSSNKDKNDYIGSGDNSLCSSRSETPDPSSGRRNTPIKRSKSGKLVSLTNKFEAEEKNPSNEASKNVSKTSNISKGTYKQSGHKLSNLTNRFGGDIYSIKETGTVKNPLTNPYSKPFSPESSLSEREKKSIAGIDVNKFGGLAKPNDYKKLKDSNKSDSSESESLGKRKNTNIKKDKLGKDTVKSEVNGEVSDSKISSDPRTTETQQSNNDTKALDENRKGKLKSTSLGTPEISEPVDGSTNKQKKLKPINNGVATNDPKQDVSESKDDASKLVDPKQTALEHRDSKICDPKRDGADAKIIDQKQETSLRGNKKINISDRQLDSSDLKDKNDIKSCNVTLEVVKPRDSGSKNFEQLQGIKVSADSGDTNSSDGKQEFVQARDYDVNNTNEKQEISKFGDFVVNACNQQQELSESRDTDMKISESTNITASEQKSEGVSGIIATGNNTKEIVTNTASSSEIQNAFKERNDSAIPNEYNNGTNNEEICKDHRKSAEEKDIVAEQSITNSVTKEQSESPKEATCVAVSGNEIEQTLGTSASVSNSLFATDNSVRPNEISSSAVNTENSQGKNEKNLISQCITDAQGTGLPTAESSIITGKEPVNTVPLGLSQSDNSNLLQSSENTEPDSVNKNVLSPINYKLEMHTDTVSNTESKSGNHLTKTDSTACAAVTVAEAQSEVLVCASASIDDKGGNSAKFDDVSTNMEVSADARENKTKVKTIDETLSSDAHSELKSVTAGVNSEICVVSDTAVHSVNVSEIHEPVSVNLELDKLSAEVPKLGTVGTQEKIVLPEGKSDTVQQEAVSLDVDTGLLGAAGSAPTNMRVNASQMTEVAPLRVLLETVDHPLSDLTMQNPLPFIDSRGTTKAPAIVSTLSSDSSFVPSLARTLSLSKVSDKASLAPNIKSLMLLEPSNIGGTVILQQISANNRKNSEVSVASTSPVSVMSSSTAQKTLHQNLEPVSQDSYKLSTQLLLPSCDSDSSPLSQPLNSRSKRKIHEAYAGVSASAIIHGVISNFKSSFSKVIMNSVQQPAVPMESKYLCASPTVSNSLLERAEEAAVPSAAASSIAVPPAIIVPEDYMNNAVGETTRLGKNCSVLADSRSATFNGIGTNGVPIESSKASSQEAESKTVTEVARTFSVRAKKSRSRSITMPEEVLHISDILKEAEERLAKALQKDPPKYKYLRSTDEEVFLDAYDPSQFDILMPLPVSDEMNLYDRRSRSSTPYKERSPTPKKIFEQTEFILAETDRILRKSKSQNSLRRSFTRSLSGANLSRLTEVAADLSEEHTTAHLAGERIEAEQTERMKLEKEIAGLQMEVKRMTDANGKLEMERLALRTEVLQHAELNGDIHDSDEAADASLYKRKYEWCLREMECLKKNVKQQQEDDLDQLLVLKKQLEKKVIDAHEETDEQRQIVTQLKKKCQRLQAEMNDMKILLEEQTSRNNLLEKKQRKFDQDVQSVQEELRNERLAKDKIQREKDQILSEKYSFEQEVTTMKLESELKEEKIASLSREIDDLNFTGKAEEEVAVLKKAKHDLELRIKDQEEELDDLAGQVQMLEGAKIRLEMSIEQMRKENRKELQQRDEEVEEVRISSQKKVKALEVQLEAEHDERTQLMREKHDLERRLADAHDRTFTSVDEDAFHKVRKELKKTKALLRDTQTMLEKSQSEGSSKLLLRQLKTQLEDAEFAKTAAIKARQSTETDIGELQIQLEEALRLKKDSEDRCTKATKEKAELQTQLEESEEEVAEVMKKYKATVSQLSVDQINIAEQAQLIAELEHDKQVLQEKLSELTNKVEVLEGETANIHTQRRLQMKIKELESKLELEMTTRQRLESQITRLKDQMDRICSECDATKLKEVQAIEQGKKISRQLRESKEDLSILQQKYTDVANRRQEVEKQFELAESEIITLKSDLKLAFKRIEDLQQALQGDISDSDTELTESDSESETSLSSYLTASMTQDRTLFSSPARTTISESPTESKMDMLMVCSPTAELMSAIQEDDEYKESFA